jgi:hypothetical protein
MPLLNKIERQHILEAIAEIDRDEYDPMYESHRYSLIFNNRNYPPKHVVRLANRIAYGGNLDALTFFPYEANRLLKKLGFTVKIKGEAPPIPHVERSPQNAKESIIKLFVNLEQLLHKIEPKAFGKSTASQISDLEHSGKIPKHIAMRMHTMRITRNKVAHESESPSDAQWKAYQADWNTIEEWWKLQK